jgi:hypothetical protein
MVEKTKILIPIAIIIAGVLIAGSVVYVKKCPSKGSFLTPQVAAQKAVDFINKNLLQQGMTASLVSVVEENGLYKLSLKIGDKEYPSFVTKDGKILFPNEGISLEEKIAQKEETPQKVEKRDRPDVKLFVMSYCPYGLQMEKAYLPVYNLLKDKADFGIYFVDYIMHEKKEIDENLRQYCVQKEQREKYSNYLSCFVKDGNFEKCLSEAGIDKDKMNSCISQTDQTYKITQSYNDKSTWLNGNFPKFDIYADLNEKYGVQGSPTVVINDVLVNVERSPEKFKEAVCQAFKTPPAECSQKLPEEATSPGFGLNTGSSSSGSCQ